MPISFNQIPASLRVPGVYVEFDNALAGGGVQSFKLLVIGQRLASGNTAAGVLKRITDPGEAELFWGRGSMIAEQFAALKKADRYIETWGLALDENAAGVAAAGTITATGPATAAGTINLYIAGKRVQVAVSATQAQNSIATAIAAAVNADTTLPVTAAVDAVTLNEVDLTCRWKGETGNTIDVRANYYQGEALPKGVALAIVAPAGGTANPSLTPAITSMGEEWWNWIVLPYTDATSLLDMETELDSRWGPMRQIGGRAFTAFRGSNSATGTFGNGRNSPHVSCMGTNVAPEPPYVWAAVNAIVAAAALSIDPARPLQRLNLTGIKAPAAEIIWTSDERNVLLFDGISTYTVATDGTVSIERQITMYQRNSAGIDEESYLSINTPETLERIRYRQRALITQKFPRHKLAEDSAPVSPGQATAQPKTIKGELLALYREMEADGWVQDYDGYKATLIAEIDAANKSRLNVLDSPKLVGQFVIHAMKTQFRR